jgi:hypothetical protein
MPPDIRIKKANIRGMQLREFEYTASPFFRSFDLFMRSGIQRIPGADLRACVHE